MTKTIADNASSDSDNQQETSQFCNFYYTGFCIGEMSCSVIRATQRIGQGFYFVPDLTVSNADLALLKEINLVIGSNEGIISPIKGGYNLKFRSKRKVELILQFLQKYPVIAGDLAKSKLELLNQVLPAIGKYSKVREKIQIIERCRKDLRDLKREGLVRKDDTNLHFAKDAVGFFLAGIIDAEGSCGLKKSGLRQQPFFAVAMKDRKIIELIKKFLNCGSIHLRSDDGLFHWEIGGKSEVLQVIQVFTLRYPSKLKKMRKRMQKLIRILNDYMPESQLNWDHNIV